MKKLTPAQLTIITAARITIVVVVTLVAERVVRNVMLSPKA